MTTIPCIPGNVFLADHFRTPAGVVRVVVIIFAAQCLPFYRMSCNPVIPDHVGSRATGISILIVGKDVNPIELRSEVYINTNTFLISLSFFQCDNDSSVSSLGTELRSGSRSLKNG